MIPHPDHLLRTLNLETGEIPGGEMVTRRLSDLRGTFTDQRAFEEALRAGDPVLYTVSAVTPADGPGQLHYGLGVLHPGRIGQEYHLTKGHYHSNRECAEVYLCLRGAGMMLLEDETTGESRLLSLGANEVVYVPGHTAHRTINVGDEPLVYVGVYPSRAGHDYGAIARRNFRMVVLAGPKGPILQPRS
jgi:glucose-6-phosphate isomerase